MPTVKHKYDIGDEVVIIHEDQPIKTVVDCVEIVKELDVKPRTFINYIFYDARFYTRVTKDESEVFANFEELGKHYAKKEEHGRKRSCKKKK